MITDQIISWFAQILNTITNILPEAPTIAEGQQCCAVIIVSSMWNALSYMCSGTCINKSPVAALVDLSTIGFVVGCAISIVAAFMIVRILLLLWQQVKW